MQKLSKHIYTVSEITQVIKGLLEEQVGEICADCFEIVPHDTPARNRTSTSSGPNHTDPGFDNVVRALEEDQ